MKFIGKLTLSLLLLLLLTLVTIYLLLQTRWGAEWVSRRISDDTAWHLSVSKIEHNFSAPGLLTLRNVSFGHDGQPAVMVAKTVNLGLTFSLFSEAPRFTRIELQDGALNAANMSANMTLPLQADRLQLRNMQLHSPRQAFNAIALNGGVIPWQPRAGNILGDKASFQASAERVTLQGVKVTNALIQGKINDNVLVINNFGGDLARGSVTGSAQRDAQGKWDVSALRLNDIRLQTDKSLGAFLQPLRSLPAVYFSRVDVTNTHLQGPDWAVTDLDLLLKSVTLSNGDWQSDDGSLALNADNFINGQLTLNDPILNLDLSPQGITDARFSSRWVNGLIRAQGSWQRQTKRLTLDELVLAGLEYTLPENWRDRWMASLPAWLDSVLVKKLSGNRNLIIDVNPQYPFQITALDTNGSDLLLAQHRQWGIWQGSLNLNAAEATFNRTDVRHPSLALNADAEQIAVTEMSAFVDKGMLEGAATLDQTPARHLSLTLNGRAVPADVLQNWGWPAPPLTGQATLQLQLNARLAAKTPLKSSANGTLTLSTDGKTLQQSMTQGEVSTHP
ncbi:AsmA family protein [Pantoea alhagi]|uniref:AsmA family protein n=1 Tax=Pantoea alhagi TaxID=1891675 RepID=UPI00202B71EA|nr:AsmA family protein [Pantoea alhagi]URQ60739.1 AsmA family protein [Pantoea alhagi]